MAGPIQFVAARGTRYWGSIKILVNILGYFVTLKLNKTVAHWRALDLVSNELNLSNLSIGLKEPLNVGFVHPGFDIPNPECFRAELDLIRH